MEEFTSAHQGIKVLGTPLGHPDFVARHLQAVAAEHQTLLDRIPRVKDLQCAWLLLLHCASARANYQLRAVNHTSRDIASLPLVLGGLGLRSAGRSRVAAHWASWAECIPMIFERHRALAERLIRELEGVPTTPCFARSSLDGVLGWSPPSWTSLANGERPESRPLEEFEPGARRGGWQHEAASRTEQRFRDEDLFARCAA